MQQSLSYYITKWIIKLKGIKKEFSQDPINYKKLRKEDVHDPKGIFSEHSQVRNFEVSKTKITEINRSERSNKLLIFIHGGAFVSGPSKHHWTTLKTIVKHTDCAAWMCDYPKAPEHDIVEISKNIDEVYNAGLSAFKSNQIILIGDSVGGTLIAALTQRLIQSKTELPKSIILISPVMDASMTNSDIEDVNKSDPMLSKIGVRSAKKMCADGKDLKDAIISPLYGSFKSFPKTIIFIAEHDITFPDQLLAIKKMENTEIDLEVIRGVNMPHIWPFLPVMKEAKSALNIIIDKIKN